MIKVLMSLQFHVYLGQSERIFHAGDVIETSVNVK